MPAPQTKQISIAGKSVTVPINVTPAQIEELARQMRAPAVDPFTKEIMIGNTRVRVPVNATPADIEAKAAELRSARPALQKFAGGVWEMANPLAMVDAALHPLDTAKNIYEAHAAEYQKAKDAELRSRTETPYGGWLPLSKLEQFGHGLATVLPIIGPAAANVGETIGRGEYAEGAGKATGLLGSVLVGPKVAKASVDAAKAAPGVALKVARSPATAVEYLGKPSTKYSARLAEEATQASKEATHRQIYDADVTKTRAADAAKVQTAQAQHAAELARHEAQQDAIAQTARERYDARRTAETTGLGGQADAAGTAAEAEVSAARQKYEAKRAADTATADAIEEAARAKHEAARIVHETAAAMSERAKRAAYDAKRAVHEANTAAEHKTALDQYNAKRAAYEASADTTERANRALYDAKRAAHEQTQGARVDTAQLQHEAQLGADEATQAARENWATERASEAERRSEAVQEAVMQQLEAMQPTNIVTDVFGELPEGAPEGTRPPIQTVQFQRPSGTTRSMQETASALRLIQQTGGEIPRAPGATAVPDLPLQPGRVRPEFVPPAAAAYPEYVPTQRAPFQEFVPPQAKAFPEHVPDPVEPFREFVPPPRKAIADFTPPGLTNRGSIAARPMAEFVPPTRNPFAEFVPPTPTTIEPYVPPTRPTLPNFYGPKTRGGELGMQVGKRALQALVLEQIWDSFNNRR